MAKLPSGFIDELKATGLPDDIIVTLIDALENSSPSTSVRANRQKPYLPDGAVRRVEWCDSGRYLDNRPVFTLMPELHQGRFYVQDASSMFITRAIKYIVNQTDGVPLTVLDACAAPGGKTTAIIDSLPDNSIVVANEYDRRRASILRENLTKWGRADVLVSTGDTSQYARVRDTFDIIAVDAPCSGEGMMRKEEAAVNQWSLSLIDECARLQREIVDNLWSALKPGGYLIYSTCTFNRRENEDNVKWIIDNFECESITLDTSRFDKIVTTGQEAGINCYRFLPGIIEGEGLFMAVIKKGGELKADIAESADKSAKKGQQKTKLPIEVLSKWVKSEYDLKLSASADGTTIDAIGQRASALLNKLVKSGVKTLRPILTLATIKGKDVIPDHALAMNEVLNDDAFPRHEVTLDQAINYLRRDAITLDDNTPRGFVLLTYDNYPLGFVKNLGNRTNNLYPQNWRILMNTHH